MFEIFVDGSANLPMNKLDGIRLMPCRLSVDGVESEYKGDLDSFDAHAYYESLRAGKKISTSLVNTHTAMSCMGPVLAEGKDAIYICMSSGISGTYQAAKIAAEELEEEYEGRHVHIVDSRGCGLGIGLLAIMGMEAKRSGSDFETVCRLLDDAVPHMCQYFTVDDLNFLKSTGRVSGATAMIGTVLNIKPVLYGTEDGHIVSSTKCRGKKKAIDTIAQMYAQKAVEPGKRIVAISHGDCAADAAELAGKIKAIAAPAELIICEHEPFSGAHVGPGMLALFFYGSER